MIDGQLYALLCPPSDIEDGEIEEVFTARVEEALVQNMLVVSTDEAVSCSRK